MTPWPPESTTETHFPALQHLNSFLTTRPCAEATEELSSFSSLRCNKTCNPSFTSCLYSSSVYMLPVWAKGLPSQPSGCTESFNSLLICSAHCDTNMGLRFIGVHSHKPVLDWKLDLLFTIILHCTVFESSLLHNLVPWCSFLVVPSGRNLIFSVS